MEKLNYTKEGVSTMFLERRITRTSWLESLLRIILIISLIILFVENGKADDVEKTYRRAVADAAVAEKEEITSNLIPIVRGNKKLLWNADESKILVCTWASQNSYEHFLKPHNRTSENPEHVVWVTTVPQVRSLCAEMLAANPQISKEAVELRLKQYLGLNPDWRYDVFIEMWVAPADLFRPCVDPQIGDNSCDLHFGDDIPAVKNIADYRVFFEHLYYKSFRGSSGVPWTGLGYTYDWGNPESEEGASEYILVPGASYEIKQEVPTMKYFRE